MKRSRLQQWSISMAADNLTAREKRVYQQFAREHAEQTRATREALAPRPPLRGAAS
jgi:hypothetical protein